MLLFKRNRRISRQTGFTLAEVMVSVFVLGTVMVIYAGTISSSVRGGRLNGQYAQATSLCQHKIDQARAVGFGRLNYDELSRADIIDDAPSTQPFRFTQADDVATFLPQATTSLSIDTVPGNPAALKVTVNVSWKNLTHRNLISTMTLYALISNAE